MLSGVKSLLEGTVPQGSALELFLHCNQASLWKKHCLFWLVRASVIAAFPPAES